ncbi:5-(carboxyamino)imidazole ribonucleotide synthase [Candidatus Synechococcus calcipolaris]|nr:5-(carboxyamino)imidazole ribonucleotide synthase [Candidatus Synechococcus calcipolaris]
MTRQIGVIGGGQLAQMLGQAAQSLDLDLIVQTPQSTDPAVSVAHEVIYAPLDDIHATAQLAEACEVITFENEFIDLNALSALAIQGVRFYPDLSTLAPLLDKYQQRCYLQELGLPVPEFSLFRGQSLPKDCLFPFVLKSRRHGYDGQGTFIIRDEKDWQAFAWEHPPSQFYLMEACVSFDKELAIIAARSPKGDIALYPIVETQQENQVCRRVIAPADISEAIASEIYGMTDKLLKSLEAVGVFGIEFFLVDQQVLINEVAPRTHNSGHYTLDACTTSQFQQHLRAITEQPLGETTLTANGAVMVNLLGYAAPEGITIDYEQKCNELAKIPNAHLHWYGKNQAYPGRKLGHITVLLETQAQAQEVIQAIEELWYSP